MTVRVTGNMEGKCGFKIRRGRWYIGPCRLGAGHADGHSPFTVEEKAERERGVYRSFPLPDARFSNQKEGSE